jgi:hypothetical protein
MQLLSHDARFFEVPYSITTEVFGQIWKLVIEYEQNFPN